MAETQSWSGLTLNPLLEYFNHASLQASPSNGDIGLRLDKG